MTQAREELEAILRMIATVEEPGGHSSFSPLLPIHLLLLLLPPPPEPGLMDQLERRLEAAEKLYTEAGLEARVHRLHQAKQRQVGCNFPNGFSNFVRLIKLVFLCRGSVIVGDLLMIFCQVEFFFMILKEKIMQTDLLFEYRATVEQLVVEYGSIQQIRSNMDQTLYLT